MAAFTTWLCAGYIIRLCLIVYGIMQDSWLAVPYTDVDYLIFSGAAKHVVQGGSPYDEPTYRYPPLLAWLLTPNLLIPAWGKILFSTLDIAVSCLVFMLVRLQGFSDIIAKRASLFWLLNPVAIIICTRGNSDALIALFVLLALTAAMLKRPALTGVLLALSIHIRLYPIIFSIPIYFSFKSRATGWKALIPNLKQITLVTSCVAVLGSVTAVCYYLYRLPYLNESILYHLSRKDTRHNFSLFFYLLYLDGEQPGWLMFLPQALILGMLSYAFHHPKDLPFCLFLQIFVVVTFNPVVTSQYWVWVLSLLPTCVPKLQLQIKSVVFFALLWGLAQLAWLVPAYLLEFRGRNTFFYIWLQCVGVFCANIAVIGRLIRAYDFKDKRE